MEGNLSHRCKFLTHVLPHGNSLWGEEAPPRQVQEATYTDLQKTYANNMLTGWWYTYPSEKYDFVSWGCEIPNILKNKNHVPNHQPEHVKTCEYWDLYIQMLY